MAEGRHFEKDKRPYHGNNLTKCTKFAWRVMLALQTVLVVKFQTLKNLRWWTVAMMRNEKLAISTQTFDRRV